LARTLLARLVLSARAAKASDEIAKGRSRQGCGPLAFLRASVDECHMNGGLSLGAAQAI
jgi:hypothetical protein